MQSTTSARMRRRIVGILIGFLVFGFSILLVQLFMITIVKGEMYQSRAAQQQTRSTLLGARRGTIYDRNNNALARSADVWNICISPAEIDEKRLPTIAKDLGAILDVDPAYITEQAGDRRVYYKRIARRVNVETRDAVLAYISKKGEEVTGVFPEPDTKRYYPYGSLASTVLGFTNSDNHGAYGLEAHYDKTLSGTPGVVVSAKNAWGIDMPYKYTQRNDAADGNSLVLTIDEGIQHFVERHLETAIVEHSIGNRAAGIVMDVNTGEILAMATKGDFDPNDPYTLQDPMAIAKLEDFKDRARRGEFTPKEIKNDIKTEEQKLRDLQFDQWRNKAISDPYEPGSTFKIVTAATALDNKVVSLTDSFVCTGSVKVSSETFHCHRLEGHGAEDFVQGMQHSCNPVFINIGQRIGGTILYDYIGNFGLGEPTGIDLPGEAEGILHSKNELMKEGKVELSSTSFGQSFKVTPLELITALSAAVNGGKLMQPYVVKQVLDPDGNVIETTQPTVRRQVISEETSATVRFLVEKVVDGGSGANAAVPGYRIGGKTGTSEILDEVGNDRYVLSFVGFAPMDNPQYAVLVMLDQPDLDNPYGSVIAAPVVGAIFQEMLPYVGIQPTFTEAERAETESEVPNLIGQKPHDAQAKLTSLGLRTRIIGSGPMVIQQIPQSGTSMLKGRTVVIYTDEDSINSEVTVPDVVGMTAQQANQAIVSDAGLNIDIRGVTEDGKITYVAEQWPLAGSTAKTGEVVIITLAEKQEETSAEAQAATTPPAVLPEKPSLFSASDEEAGPDPEE